LDSNNVNVGPNIFQVGARVCNVGDETATNVTTRFVRDGAINPYISLQGSSTLTLPALPPGPTSHPPGNTGPTPANCADFYYNVLISRTSAAYDTTQPYHIEATADGLGTVSTPTNRELYVEHLISQNRNEVTSFTGPTQVVVGQTYFYTVTAKTATNGYEQLVTSVDFPNILFQTLAVTVTYTAPPTPPTTPSMPMPAAGTRISGRLLPRGPTAVVWGRRTIRAARPAAISRWSTRS